MSIKTLLIDTSHSLVIASSYGTPPEIAGEDSSAALYHGRVLELKLSGGV